MQAERDRRGGDDAGSFAANSDIVRDHNALFDALSLQVRVGYSSRLLSSEALRPQ